MCPQFVVYDEDYGDKSRKQWPDEGYVGSDDEGFPEFSFKGQPGNFDIIEVRNSFLDYYGHNADGSTTRRKNWEKSWNKRALFNFRVKMENKDYSMSEFLTRVANATGEKSIQIGDNIKIGNQKVNIFFSPKQGMQFRYAKGRRDGKSGRIVKLPKKSPYTRIRKGFQARWKEERKKK